MALRAGYYGLKNSVKRTLEKLASDMAGAKIIKSIGDGLSLSDQGSLAASIDPDTMEIKNHKLAAKVQSSGFDYSTTEFDTGMKWIDGKPVYGLVIEKTFSLTNTGTTSNDIIFNAGQLPNVETVISVIAARERTDEVKASYINVPSSFWYSDNMIKMYTSQQWSNLTHLILFYTKVDAE